MSELQTAIPEMNEASAARVAVAKQLPRGARVHVAGVCGTGTASVAQLLKQLGYYVTGSDKAFYPPMGDVVRETIDEVYEGFAAAHIDRARPDLVVIGNSLSRGNPELEAILEKNLPYASMPEIFAALLVGDRTFCGTSIVVIGTHGKTTTTAAIATMLDHAGYKPGYFVGGVPKNLPSSIRPPDFDRPPSERVVVLEGDEYDSAFFAKWPKFHHYRPDILIVTSLEFDHGDIYRDLEEIENEFTRVARRVPSAGRILLCSDRPELIMLREKWEKDSKIVAKLGSYGTSPGEVQLVSRVPAPPGQDLTVLIDGQTVEFSTNLPGEYNALNLTAAVGVGYALRLPTSAIAAGLGSFESVLRRQQRVFEGRVTVIEDFAHHPTAVAETLRGLREQFASGRLIAVYEPRSNTSRRAFFQEQYIKAFAPADLVFIRAVQAGSNYSNTGAHDFLDVAQLCEAIKNSGKPTESFHEIEPFISSLLPQLEDGDVIAVMSNGDFGGLPKKLPAALAK